MFRSMRVAVVLGAVLLTGCGGGGGGSSLTTSSGSATSANVISVLPANTSAGTSTAFQGSGFSYPVGLAIYGSTLYVADAANDAITEVDLTSASFTSKQLNLVWSGPSGSARALAAPMGLAVSPDGSTLYAANFGNTTQSAFIAAITLSSGAATQLQITGSGPAIDNPTDVAVDDANGSLYVANHGGTNLLQLTPGSGTGTYTVAAFYPATGSGISFLPSSVAKANGLVYVTDGDAAVLGAFPLSAGVLQTSGYTAVATGFGAPSGIVKIGNYLYVADYKNETIRKIDPANGYATVKTLNVAPRQPFFLATDGVNLFFSDGNDGSVDAILNP